MTVYSNINNTHKEGQLLVTEANCNIREDSSVFVRSALSSVKNGKIMIEIINLGQSTVMMGKGERLTRAFPVELKEEVKMMHKEQLSMHRKVVRKKRQRQN